MAAPAPGPAGARVVFDPEWLKQQMKDQEDRAVDAVAIVTKSVARTAIENLPQAGAVVSASLQAVVTTASATVPQMQSVAFMAPVVNAGIDRSVTAGVEQSQESSAPRVDPLVDRSAASTKEGSHQSTDRSIDAAVSSIR